ncbi:hypothetical protein D3C83_57570 [compost metagenome]
MADFLAGTGLVAGSVALTAGAAGTAAGVFGVGVATATLSGLAAEAFGERELLENRSLMRFSLVCKGVLALSSCSALS